MTSSHMRLLPLLLAPLVAAVAAEGPLSVRLERPDRADLLAGRTVLRATVAAPVGVAVSEVRFVIDGALVGVDREPPYRVVWDRIDTLRDHLLRVTAVAADGSRAYDLVSVPVLGPVDRTTVSAYPPSFVLMDVTFLDDEGRPVVDVRADEVRLSENGKRQEIELLEPDVRPLAAELLLDASHSTRPYWGPIARSAKLFARTLRQGDRATVEAFHDYSYVITPMGSRPEEMARAVERFRDWGGGTRLYDSLSRAALYTLGPESFERRALIVLTDGVDQGSTLGVEDAREYVMRGELELHAVLFEATLTIWPGVYHRDPDGRRARRLVSKMAAATGGATYDPGGQPLEEIFLEIGERLRAQYLLGYTSDARSDPGEPRRVEVRLKRRGIHHANVRKSHFGDEALGGFLARQMTDSSETRQLVAARAAAFSRDPAAVRALVRSLGDGRGMDRGLPKEARLSLIGQGSDAVPYLVEALAEDPIGGGAARVLVETLVLLLRSSRPEDLAEAIETLGAGDANAGRQRLRDLGNADLDAGTRGLLDELLLHLSR